MSIPKVYAAIAAVTAEFARNGIAKSQLNTDEQYAYRGIDEITGRLAPLLSEHRLCILPRVLERTERERVGKHHDLLVSVSLKVAFDMVSARDGSCHSIETYGEALDAGDKATSKALSAAYKTAVLQAFCIPVKGRDDADASTYRLKADNDSADPAQGWEQWSDDIIDIVLVCESVEALDRLQDRYRAQLRSVSKRRPELYRKIGETIRKRREALLPPGQSAGDDKRQGGQLALPSVQAISATRSARPVSTEKGSPAIPDVLLSPEMGTPEVANA